MYEKLTQQTIKTTEVIHKEYEIEKTCVQMIRLVV